MSLLRPGGLLVLQSPEADVKLLTRLLKLAAPSEREAGGVSDPIVRAIQIRGMAKVLHNMSSCLLHFISALLFIRIIAPQLDEIV